MVPKGVFSETNMCVYLRVKCSIIITRVISSSLPHLKKKLLKIPPRLGLIPLGLTAATSTTDVAIHKNMFGAGITTLMVLNEEMNI